MKILALDSSSLVASVAIITDDILTAEYTINYKKTHSQTLLPMLDEMAKNIDLDLNSIDAIAIASGPGSFTGLRIGAATAKGLGLALNKPIIAVPTLEAMAYNIYTFDRFIVPIMDARRDQVYTGIYQMEEEEIKIIKCPCAIAIEELLEELNRWQEKVVFVGDGIPVMKEKIEEKLKVSYQFVPAHLNRQRASAVGALGSIYYQKGKIETAAEHKPDYLRLSQAEREFAQKNQKILKMREMEEKDLEKVFEIEKQSFSIPWSEQSFLETKKNKDFYYWVAEEQGEVIAYLNLQKILEEGDIYKIAVRLDKRRQGIGEQLLEYAIQEAKKEGITQITLEVRKSNTAAISLYQKKGFSQEGIRPDYYEKPKEDAIIMWKRVL